MDTSEAIKILQEIRAANSITDQDKNYKALSIAIEALKGLLGDCDKRINKI